jgi:hypothetical protein
VERRAEPSTHRRETERELLWVARAVGRVVDRARESRVSVTKCRFERDDLVEVEDRLVSAVFGQQPRIVFGREKIGFLVEQVQHAGAGLPVLQPLTGGQFVHQLLAVAGESQFRQGVGAGPRRCALADEPYAPSHQVRVRSWADSNRCRLAEQRLHQHRRRFR